MYRWSRLATAAAVLATTLSFSACAAPPNREIGDAEQALKQAKDAGAERYAAESYAAAAEAYRLANQAVMAGDYRLALNRALESRGHAQTANREAVEGHAQAREQVLQAVSDVSALLTRATEAADAAERARAPRTVVKDVRQALTLVAADVQKARAAIDRQEYEDARAVLEMTKARLDAAFADLEAAKTPQRSKRARR